MIKQVWENLLATKIFFFVRFVAAAIVGIVYLLVAAGIQYTFVEWFGETTFNYIVGGVLSMYLGALACTYLGRLLFMFVRGWHMGALAFSKQIRNKNLPALEVGMTVFRKHFTSFATVYGASILIKKFAEKGSEELWEMLQDVPYLCSLERFSKNPIVAKVGADILDTAFDGVVYYLVKYTKPGLGDDISAFPDALKRYLYALPQVLITSLSAYLLLYTVPKVIRLVLMISLIWNNGLVAGILLNVLCYPVFYVIKHAVFEPLETILLISCYSKHCKEEPVDDGIYKTFVDKILEAVGFESAMDGDREDEGEEPSREEDTAEEEPVSEPDIISDVEPVFEEDPPPPPRPPRNAMDSLNAIIQRADEDANVSDLPLADDITESNVRDDIPASGFANLNSLIEQMGPSTGGGADEDEEADSEDEEEVPPVTRLSDLLGSLSPSSMQEAFGAVTPEYNPEEEELEDPNPLGGGRIDLL